MKKGRAFLVNVSIHDLPFPIKVLSGSSKTGQNTVANISVQARIMKEFEAEWIDKFIQVTHKHRDNIGPEHIKSSVKDYLEALNANSVRIEMSFPYFVEKRTPKSNEPCLVKYDCTYTSLFPSLDNEVKIIFGIKCPVITSYPIDSQAAGKKNSFPQLSILRIEVQPKGEIYPEELIKLADSKSLAPIYSFLSKEDQLYLIEKTQQNYHSSVDMVDEIRLELAKNKDIGWYSISSSNYGMLHNYTTLISLEKSRWVPGSYYDDEEV